MQGSVDRLRERVDAERAVRYLQGVRGVTNKIVVRPSTVRLEQVREVIEEALERCAEREAECEAKRIQVQVGDGAVTLTGRAYSYAEKRAVMDASVSARRAHGQGSSPY